ncbi:MAG: phosphoglucomutase/phosphomannomutase family protein [Chloroflexi bacterium]|nr:phosphoglucomutase/phosphomannomutase family protein [Chloroflexota bacterium]MCL5108158.1 phosphoglucomutase/phosphomannomutase family protein [Chloroflexota bacterium]
MGTEIKFGTDGWRAVIAEDYTYDNVRLCAQSVASYLHDTGVTDRGFVVGYDTRFASEHFGVAVAEVLAGNGIVTHLCEKAAPTPVISYSILMEQAAGAAVITASHNPAIWNGFKYKPEYAGSASPEVVAELEKRIVAIQQEGASVKRLPIAAAVDKGLVHYLDPAPKYLQHIGELVDLKKLQRAGLRIVADAMYGAGAGYFQRLLEGGSTGVLPLHQERNPAFPGLERPEPIDENLHELRRVVPEQGASLGLATDGDADRIGAVDENGHYINQLWMYGLLALYLLEVRKWRGPLVKSLTTTSMIEELGKLYDVPVYETPVGFKYIGPKMLQVGAIVGGEESGGFGFRGHIPERDGVLSGLFLTDMMVSLSRTPSELVQYLFDKVGPHYYDRLDLTFPADQRQAIIQRIREAKPSTIDGSRVTEVKTVDGFKFMLADGGWLLVRFSGTEPVIRIYTETDSPERVERIITAGRQMAGL